MEQEHLFILDLIETGKITIPEALELIEAVDDGNLDEDETATPSCEEIITVHLFLS